MKHSFLLALLPLVSSAWALTPAEVTKKQVEATKYGMEQGCRAQGAARNDPPAIINATCQCASLILNSQLTFKQWQEFYYYDRTKQTDKVEKIYQEHGPAVRACTDQALDNPATLPKSAKPPPSLLGTWEWTMKPNNCRESYTFKAGGTLGMVSGAEKSEGTYQLDPVMDVSGRYKLAITVTKDHGGVDCSGKLDDNAGQVNTLYLSFAYDADTMAMCFTPGGSQCIGPLKKRR